MDQAPPAVRWALGLACLFSLAALALSAALFFDSDLSWGIWDNIRIGHTTVEDAGWMPTLVVSLALLAYSLSLIVGLVDQRRWGQFMGVILFGGAAGQAIVDLGSGRFNLSAPLLVWLAWALFSSKGWFAGPGPDGDAPSTGRPSSS